MHRLPPCLNCETEESNPEDLFCSPECRAEYEGEMDKIPSDAGLYTECQTCPMCSCPGME